jgi:RNA polymerase sigma-70 factor (ECF subfamily)
MLRITCTPGPVPVLRIEGNLAGQFVEELRAVCRQHSGPGAKLRIELAGTSFADPSGVALLDELAAAGAELVGATPFLRELLRHAAARRRAANVEAWEAGRIEALRRGDESAREELVRTFGPRMLSTARRFLSEPGAAEQALREAFCAAFDELERLRPGTSLAGWLHAHVLRIVLARAGAQDESDTLLPRFAPSGVRRYDDADEHLGPGETPDESDGMTPELAARVRGCVGRLPDALRAILLLCDVEGYDVAQAAELLGLDPREARQRRHQARQALRLLLGRALAGPAHSLSA